MNDQAPHRLIVVSAFDYPTRYAHALHGLHMARAFAKELGNSFLCIINTAVDPTQLSGIQYRRLFGAFGRVIKKLHLRRVLIPISLIWFFITNKKWSGKGTVVFTTDPAFFAPLIFIKKLFGVSLVCECHGTFTTLQSARAARHMSAIFFVTTSLKTEWIGQHPECRDKAHLLPNAVDVESFTVVSDDVTALRQKLGLPIEKKLVGYVGRFEPLGQDKGLHLMIDAVGDLPQDIALVLVGGTKDEIAHYAEYCASKGMAERVLLVPYVTSGQVPEYEKACDVLAYVPSAQTAFFEKETSPMKLFEYMAARRPIIVSDSPAMREILDDSSALFVDPGSSEQFVHAVKDILTHPEAARSLAEAAFEKVVDNTWQHRAQNILQQIGLHSA